MSTGRPSDPVCENQTTAMIASPTKTGSTGNPIDPVCRSITPPTADQTATPGAPP